MRDDTGQAAARSRRAVLGAAVGAIGLAAARLGVATPARAATGTMVFGDDNDAGDAETTLTSTDPFRTLQITGSGAYALAGEGTGAESTGVVGTGSGPGTGVRGQSPNGTGVLAESAAGRALAVDGRAGFLTGGSVSVLAGRASVSVSRPWVKAGSLVVATIQRDRPDAYVRGVLVSDGKFQILLNRKVAHSTKIAFFVFEQVAPFPD